MTYAFIALGLVIGFVLGAKATHAICRTRYRAARHDALQWRSSLLDLQAQLRAIPSALRQEWIVPRSARK